MNHLYNYNIHMLLSFSEISMRHLQLFVTVAQTESFSRAAAMLGVSQSLISKSMSDLEKIVGSELVIRDRQKTTLTQAGKVMYREASALLRQLNNTERLIRRFDVESNLEGTLDVGYEMMFPRALVTQTALRFKQETPNAVLNLHKTSFPGLTNMLEANDVDLGLILNPLEGELEKPFFEEPIGEDTLSVVAHRSLLPANTLEYHIGLVECLPTVLISSDARGINSALRVCRDLGTAPELFFCSDVDEILSQVEAGSCVSFLPEKIIREYHSPFLVSYPLRELEDAQISLTAAIPAEGKTVLLSRFLCTMADVYRELFAPNAGNESPV